MDVSIIVVNWNTRELLLECLASVFRENSGVSFEVIVVDNGSTDGSGEAVQRYFPRVVLIQNPENRGFARANNQAMAIATGRYFLLLNSDARLTEGSLQEMVSFMDATPRAGIAAGQYLNRDGSKQNSFDNFPTLATELLNKGLLRILFPRRYPSKNKEYILPVEVESVLGACMIVRREVLKEVGMLDEDYFFFMEETDWCYRLRKAGWGIYHLPHIRILHLQGQSKEKDPARAWIEYYRSSYLFFRKHRSIFTYVVLRFLRVIKLVVNLVLVILGLMLTFGSSKGLRRKLYIYNRLLFWHLKLCPGEEGLQACQHR